MKNSTIKIEKYIYLLIKTFEAKTCIVVATIVIKIASIMFLPNNGHVFETCLICQYATDNMAAACLQKNHRRDSIAMIKILSVCSVKKQHYVGKSSS